MMNDAKYQENWNKKQLLYARHGIREGKNLLVTFDAEDGGIDSSELQRIIEMYFL